MFLSYMNMISEGTDSTYHLVKPHWSAVEHWGRGGYSEYLTLNNSQPQRSHQCLQRPVCHQFLFQEDVKAMKLNEPS